MDGIVYAASLEGTIGAYALDGTEQWTYEIDEFFAAGPATDGDAVYAATQSGPALALDAADGSERWVRQHDFAAVRSEPVVAGDVLIVTSVNGVFALDRTSGDVTWQPSHYTHGDYPAAVGENRVYLSMYATSSQPDADNIVALDLASGDEQWRFDYRREGRLTTAPTVAGGSIYVGTSEEFLVLG